MTRRMDRRQYGDINVARSGAEHFGRVLLAAGRYRIDVKQERLPRRRAFTDCAASPLDAAVTAEMTSSACRTASAAEEAQCTPLASAARRNLLPALCGKRISQAVICAASASCSPAAMAWPASPKPMKAILGLPLAMDSS